MRIAKKSLSFALILAAILVLCACADDSYVESAQKIRAGSSSAIVDGEAQKVYSDNPYVTRSEIEQMIETTNEIARSAGYFEGLHDGLTVSSGCSCGCPKCIKTDGSRPLTITAASDSEAERKDADANPQDNPVLSSLPVVRDVLNTLDRNPTPAPPLGQDASLGALENEPTSGPPIDPDGVDEGQMSSSPIDPDSAGEDQIQPKYDPNKYRP